MGQACCARGVGQRAAGDDPTRPTFSAAINVADDWVHVSLNNDNTGMRQHVRLHKGIPSHAYSGCPADGGSPTPGLHLLGSGATSTVYRVEHRATARRFAMKVVDLEKCGQQARTELRREVEILTCA